MANDKHYLAVDAAISGLVIRTLAYIKIAYRYPDSKMDAEDMDLLFGGIQGLVNHDPDVLSIREEYQEQRRVFERKYGARPRDTDNPAHQDPGEVSVTPAHILGIEVPMDLMESVAQLSVTAQQVLMHKYALAQSEISLEEKLVHREYLDRLYEDLKAFPDDTVTVVAEAVYQLALKPGQHKANNVDLLMRAAVLEVERATNKVVDFDL